MNQYLLFKSRGALHAVNIEDVAGIGGDIGDEAQEVISAAVCFYGDKEEEKHSIKFGTTILKVAEVLDLVKFDEIYDKPAFFKNVPINGVGVLEDEIAILLKLKDIVNHCLKKGENYEW